MVKKNDENIKECKSRLQGTH